MVVHHGDRKGTQQNQVVPEVKTQVAQLNAEALKAFAIWGQALLALETKTHMKEHSLH